ncbi:hypothetical protein M427DRAFT_378288 [Gonapodya prolifera JEL478]|uniref:Uncharacterized protein n=1 Tax=Gonapodya prolifera (strain JEL478) TaxID=1344416 RepID=A0A139AUZ8_GONPJ|nr:hypothetical protein M427DRAFT_378288 [Gonapodya prolifera JEL478]|eukprot:KXS20560.1 hypothetical protein M427DRAFT_378288 [Gonapodya prolifera JEL478]
MNFTSSADTERFSTLREAWGLIVNSGIDWSRVGVMVGFGFFFAGPAYTFWYKLLDHKATALLARTTSSSRARTAAWWAAWGAWAVSCGKTVADLTVFDPIYLPLFFMSTNLVSGCSFDEAGKRLRKDFAGTYVVDVAIWAPVQLFNFRFIPLLYQPLLVNGVNVFWNAYLR